MGAAELAGDLKHGEANPAGDSRPGGPRCGGPGHGEVSETARLIVADEW